MLGRKPKGIDAALTFLIDACYKGATISATYAMTSGPAGKRTMYKAKKILGLEAVKGPRGWYWRYPIKDAVKAPEPIKPEPIPQPIDNTPHNYDPDGYHADTVEITWMTKNMILEGKETEDIVREAILGCAKFPMRYPYSREYIESVVRHEAEGTPIRTDLNQNES